jgi:hypothetical protein
MDCHSEDKETGKLLKEAYVLCLPGNQMSFFKKLSAMPGVCRMFDNWQRIEGYILGLKDCGREVTIVSFEYGNRTLEYGNKTRDGGYQNVCILGLTDPESFRVAAETEFAHVVAREVHET